MTSAKAYAGGLTAALASVLMYFLDLWPPVAHMPADVHSALTFTLTGVLTALAVYWIPNRETTS